jgi:hypothetical protein
MGLLAFADTVLFSVNSAVFNIVTVILTKSKDENKLCFSQENT